MKNILYMIGLVVLIFIILGIGLRNLINNPKHICSDITHITCDEYCVCDGMECTGVKDSALLQTFGNVYGKCTFEGMECPNAQKYARSYQISLTQDSIYIWDGDIQITVLPLEWNNQLGAIILKDNQ